MKDIEKILAVCGTGFVAYGAYQTFAAKADDVQSHGLTLTGGALLVITFISMVSRTEQFVDAIESL